MDFEIGDFKLDVTQNQLVSSASVQTVRPKTMALLLYFIRHQDQIVPKQTLLDDVWNSAGAQEHVLFQSIKEIRELFAPLNVIKTHPRVGYQWIAPIKEIETKSPSETAPRRSNYVRFGLVAAVLFTLTMIVILAQQAPPISPSPQADLNKTLSREIIVLPFEVEVDGNGEDWVRLGAMDMMINKLKGLDQFAIPNAEDVMMAIARTEAFATQDMEHQSYAVRTQVGESVTLHTKLLGAPMEYQLHYSLVGRYQTKQGLLFGDTVGQLLDDLVKDILRIYQVTENQVPSSLAQTSADYTLLQAMEGFHHGHMDKAEIFFKAYLQTHGNNLTAQRYLLKVKIAKGKLSEASALGQAALAQSRNEGNHQETVRLLFELGVVASLKQDMNQAQELLSLSRELAEQHRDNLYAAFSHTQLGHLMVQQQQYSQAKGMYQQALEYHESFQCPYGQISNLHALSMLYANEQDILQSEAMLNKAIDIAQANQLNHEHAHLLLNKIARGMAGKNRELWLTRAEKLISELQDSDFKSHFVNRLKRLNDAPPAP